MIAACPKCDARYRVDESKVGPEGARLRCAKCQAVFRVRPPAAAPAAQTAAPPAPAEASAAPPGPAATTGEQAAAHAGDDLGMGAGSRVGEEIEYDRERLVLVADPRDDSGKRTVGALTAWGLQPLLVPDGVEAMLAIQRLLPRVIVLDAALPKMYGFQVCEVVKRNESLKDTHVVLVGSIHNRERYRRPPSELYGADHYLEQPDLPDALRPLLAQWGMPVTDDASAPTDGAAAGSPAAPSAATEGGVTQTDPAPPSGVEPPPAPVSAPAAAAPPRESSEPVGDGLDDERAKAERLARIVVSDIVLYQGDKFDEGVRSGKLLELIDAEIEEGRNFFRQRIGEQVRGERDHLMDELMRVAREKGMA